MLTYYTLDRGCLVPTDRPDGCPHVAWVDLHSPTEAEEREVEECLGLDIPTKAEMRDIEASSRLYVDKGALVLTVDLVSNATGPDPRVEPVTFLLRPDGQGGGCLVTLRYCELRSFALFVQGCNREPLEAADPWTVFLGILETVVERLAETLEKVGEDLDDLTRRIFRRGSRKQLATASAPRADLSVVLERIGQHHDVVSKVRTSLLGLGRMATYVAQRREAHLKPPPEALARLDAFRVDLASLSEHDNVLSAKVDFMLDATLGLINVEQNGIIKIFSVVSVIFMPPTLVASIYGMNFDWMPELKWPYGYPFALFLMLCAAVLPYLYFKWRRWL